MTPAVLNSIRALRRLSSLIGSLVIFGLVFCGMALQFSGKELERADMEVALKCAFVALGIKVLIDIFFGDKLKANT